MTLWVFNDSHLGVRRSGGTTAASALALRQWAQQQWRDLLARAQEGDAILINGDLTDQFDIDLGDALDIFESLADAAQRVRAIYLALGNHDLSKNSAKLGTVQFLARLLALRTDRVVLIDQPATVEGCVHVIPHLTNQALFEQALDNVPDGTKFLLLHCNYDSPFAEHSDHSLNLDRERAKSFIERGIRLVLGHEHHQRQFFGGKLLITGNQFPTSIADCVTPQGKQAHSKQCARIDGDELVLADTWFPGQPDGGFVQVQWQEGEPLEAGQARFVRVTGEVKPEQASAALKAIGRLRQTSDAFVIANAIRVKGQQNAVEQATEGVNDVQKLDVIQMLLEALTPDQRRVVQEILAKK